MFDKSVYCLLHALIFLLDFICSVSFPKKEYITHIELLFLFVLYRIMVHNKYQQF